MQSQTTFAKLDKDEEGHWMPRVIKQKIWVEGTSYELQEIYGIENSSAGRSSADTGKQVTLLQAVMGSASHPELQVQKHLLCGTCLPCCRLMLLFIALAYRE